MLERTRLLSTSNRQKLAVSVAKLHAAVHPLNRRHVPAGSHVGPGAAIQQSASHRYPAGHRMPSFDAVVAITCCPNRSVATTGSYASALDLHNDGIVISRLVNAAVEKERVDVGSLGSRAANEQQCEIQGYPHSFPQFSAPHAATTTRSSE